MKKRNQQEQRREYRNLGLDLGERVEHVSCHASSLVLSITNEACREADM